MDAYRLGEKLHTAHARPRRLLDQPCKVVRFAEPWPHHSIIKSSSWRRTGAAAAAAAAADLVVDHAPDGLQEELLPRMAPLPAAVLQARLARAPSASAFPAFCQCRVGFGRQQARPLMAASCVRARKPLKRVAAAGCDGR
jgi:hypothetical protein